MKADSALVAVWWLWLVPGLLASVLPVEFAVALCTRGLESVRSSGISGGFAIITMSGVLSFSSFPLLLVLTPLYALLFWNRRRRGVKPSARLWTPIHGSVLLILAWSLMLLTLRAGD